jgi:hypothetical protein
VGFPAPSTRSIRGIHFPTRPDRCPLLPATIHRDVPDCSGTPTPRLVAGFHTRFGPSPPFFTTLTACSPPDPVTFFSH